MTPQWGGHVRSRDKLNTYIHLQKNHGHQTRQSVDLPWGPPTIKTIWLFYHVTNVRSCDNFIYLYLHLTYGSTQTLKSPLTSSFSSVFLDGTTKPFSHVSDQDQTHWHDMSCAFMSCALGTDSNGGFKQSCGIFLFNHESCYIFTTAIPMDTKCDRVVTYHEGRSPLKSHEPLITWSLTSCEKLKPLYLSYKQYLWAANLTGFNLHDPLILWFCGITWPNKT